MPLIASPAVLRALDVLEAMAADPGAALTVSELARRLEMPRATCHSVLIALTERGYVMRGDGDLRYQLGPATIAVGDAARSINSALEVTAHQAQLLAVQTSTCVAVSLRSGDETRLVQLFDHGGPFAGRGQVGQSMRLAPPFGAAFVAWGGEAEITAWLDAAGVPLDKKARTRYREALRAVRKRGYSITVATPRNPEFAAALKTLATRPDAEDARRVRDELALELTHSEYLPADLDDTGSVRMLQASAPVFDARGRAVAKIMLFGPGYDLTAQEVDAIGTGVRAAADRATRNNGGRQPESS
ncbi:MAG: helix-turn-helix domain-containing protein [Streptomycetaceae bacterium]|nr:helix-turn-helix domain-containing protein [Streptomycetaceae bacterium]